MLKEKGLKVGENYEEVFVGVYDVVVVVVVNGKVEVGGLSKFIFMGLIEKGIIDKNKVIVIVEFKFFF